jgi:hypothetical protein
VPEFAFDFEADEPLHRLLEDAFENLNVRGELSTRAARSCDVTELSNSSDAESGSTQEVTAIEST